MDKIILGQGYSIEEETGGFRPNNNQIVVGCSGTGKSMSIMLPTILNMHESSMIGTYSKPAEARRIAHYQEINGYKVEVCDLTHPAESTVTFDPLKYVKSSLDIEDLAKNIVFANPMNRHTRDQYFYESATSLLSSLILATIETTEDPGMSDVLDLFDRMKLRQDNRGFTSSLDSFYEEIRFNDPNCPAVTRYNDFRHLPYNTAGCVRDTLANAIRNMFPESIREIMKDNHSVDFKKLATEKTSLIIITSSVNVSLYTFANLLFSSAIKQLLEYAESFEDKKLPRPVRLMFDDFACGAKINNFSKHISIFRAAGLSAMMLLQSESQLIELYSNPEATSILNNCSCYAYFPGGMDLTTCSNISTRLDRPITEIMYAPTKHVIIMQSGKKPVTVPRYDTLNSEEYKKYIELTAEPEMEKEV